MKHVLFVCVENSCRSQMAEAFVNMHGGDDVKAYSAGSKPSGVVNPKAIASMAALDYDLSTHVSVGTDALPDIEFDVVVTMGCGDACPVVPHKKYEDWSIQDPKHMDPDEFAEVRDMISVKVRDMLLDLS